MKDTSILFTTLLSLSAATTTGSSSLLRGRHSHVMDTPSSHSYSRRLPEHNKKELKQLNDERKRQNEQLARKKQDKEWDALSKEEKKKLLAELKTEEEELEGKLDKKGKKQKEELADSPSPLEQYTLLSTDIDTSDPKQLNSLWKELTKEEKQQILDLSEGKLIVDGGKVMINPDYIPDDKLTKKEKKEQMKLNNEMGQNSEETGSTTEEPKGKDEKPETNDSSSSGKGEVSASSNFAASDEEKPKNDVSNQNGNSEKPKDEDTTNGGSSEKEEESASSNFVIKPQENENNEDMVQQSNNFVLSESQGTETATSTTAKPTGNTVVEDATTTAVPKPKGNGIYTFSSTLFDPSTPIDSSDLEWTMSGKPWTTGFNCQGSNSCFVSGIGAQEELVVEEPIYSNLTLTTESSFEGGVLTFHANQEGELSLPHQAFFVTVDDAIKSTVVSSDGSLTEYSVVVGRGKHAVTWSHVYNPLGLEALPEGEIGSLRMEDLRYSPFGNTAKQGFEKQDEGISMISDGDGTWIVDPWAANSGYYSIIAKTADIKEDSGSANVRFVLYSEFGGTLWYKISTSITAPHDDFAVSLNGRAVEAFCGETRTLPAFDYRDLGIPMGKVVVTFQHRKNPGQLTDEVLESLGKVETRGLTRLDDIMFEPHRM